MKTLPKCILSTGLALGLICAANVASADSFRFNINLGGRRLQPPPPPPTVIVQPWQQPAPAAVWVPPHNEWDGYRWVWVQGYYAYPPRPGVVWYPGHIEHRRNGHIWIQGCWR